MKGLTLKPKPAKPINAAELENLFASGLSQEQIARRLGMDKSSLSYRINNSASLLEARERGLIRRLND